MSIIKFFFSKNLKKYFHNYQITLFDNKNAEFFESQITATENSIK